jgi:methylated-DNA-protein-cysteine methyltransferase related protein
MLDIIRDTVRKIPKGKVSTYGEVAKAAGFPGSARQVVWALHRSRGLPWHRVLGAGGKILLPGDSGLEQRMRLETEGVAFRNGRVWIEKHRHTFPRRAPRKRAPSKRKT